MTELSVFSKKSTGARHWMKRHDLSSVAVLTSVLCLGGCAVELENRQAAQEVARLSQPAGSVYIGWRVFQDRCASCHGPDANGTERAPDLLPRVREMGPRRFVGLVLKRYDWNLPLTQARSNDTAMDALVEEIMQRQGPVIVMPAWEDEPRVNAHIMDLHAYLLARAEGVQRPGRPLP